MKVKPQMVSGTLSQLTKAKTSENDQTCTLRTKLASGCSATIAYRGYSGLPSRMADSISVAIVASYIVFPYPSIRLDQYNRRVSAGVAPSPKNDPRLGV